MNSVAKTKHLGAMRWAAVSAGLLGIGLLPQAHALLLHTPTTGNTQAHAPGYLGVEFHDMADEAVAAAHVPGGHGVEVVMVDHDGPAAKAGVQPRDIILQLDGKPLDNAEDLRRRMRESAPGRTVQLSLLRRGQALTVSAKLADREALERDAWDQHLVVPQAAVPDPPDSIVVESFTVRQSPAPRSSGHSQSFLGTVLHTAPYTGAELDSIEPQLAQFFGAPANSGLLVHGVDANSPAGIAGLRAGDVVLRVDGNAVATTSEWTRRVRAAGGHPIALTVLREKHEMTLTLQPDAKRHSLLEWPHIF